MVSDVQDGGRNSKEHKFGIFHFSCVMVFVMRLYFCQQHEPRANFVKLVKICGSIRNGGSKSNFLALLLGFPIICQSSFCIHMVLVGRKFSRFFSKKSKMAAKLVF
jgi:hypothetical protein